MRRAVVQTSHATLGFVLAGTLGSISACGPPESGHVRLDLADADAATAISDPGRLPGPARGRGSQMTRQHARPDRGQTLHQRAAIRS